MWGCLEIRYHSAIMLPPNKAPWGFIRGGIVCKKGAYSRELIRRGAYASMYGVSFYDLCSLVRDMYMTLFSHSRSIFQTLTHKFSHVVRNISI